MADQLTSSYYDCAGQDLWTAAADITNYEYGSVDWSQSVWLGVDSNDCLWIGLESGVEVCKKLGCPEEYDSDHTIWDVRHFLDDVAPGIIEFIQDYTNGNPETGSDAHVVSAIALAAAAYVLYSRNNGLAA